MEKTKKILYICGSLNQTTMMHQISQHLSDFESYFTPYYADGFVNQLAMAGYLEFTILGNKLKEKAEIYLREHNLEIDPYGTGNDYDLVLTCSDLIIPRNIRDKRLILVQEGMTDPKTIMYYLVKWMKLPRYMASTATTGMSNAFDYFCVASEGYREHFLKNKVGAEKIIVTGIPNYDNCEQYLNNDFPYRNYVLAATSDSRETYRFENRKKFIYKALDIAAGRQLIFKLHPNENFGRAIKEINKWAPGALVYTNGNPHEMIANCDALVTKFSTLVYTGIALGKDVYSDFTVEMLRKLSPLQNGGASANNISIIARNLLEQEVDRKPSKKRLFKKIRSKLHDAKIRRNNKILGKRKPEIRKKTI